MTIGSRVAKMPVAPRNRTRDPAPTIPLDRITLTPGTRAASNSDRVRANDVAIIAESMTPVDAPSERGSR